MLFSLDESKSGRVNDDVEDFGHVLSLDLKPKGCEMNPTANHITAQVAPTAKLANNNRNNKIKIK